MKCLGIHVSCTMCVGLFASWYRGGVGMFGAVIIHIGNYERSIVTKLILIIPTAEPVEAHVHDFGAFGNYGIVCDHRSGGVIRLEA